MQVTEVAAEGLKREYKVTVAADEIEGRVDQRLKKLAKTAKMPGFRPGKVPLGLLRKQYGRSVMGEVLEQAVEEGSRKAIDDNELRPALRPNIEVTSFDDGKDLEFKMDLEVLPAVPEVDLGTIALERQVADVDPEQVRKSLENLARAKRDFKPAEDGRAAAAGDRLLIDFKGTLEGEPFEGGSAENHTLDLGSNRMIPGFEDQLIGRRAGEEVTVDVTFPENYGAAELAGKPARFAVTIKEIRTAEPVAIDDELAKQFGADDLAALETMLTERLAADQAGAARAKLKRQLLDKLAEAHDFPVPAGMVDLEFEAIWKQLTDEMQRAGSSFDEGEETEAKAREEYRRIAERRVRLGLLLSDVGTKNEVTVEPQELQQALLAQARRFPGEERKVFDYFRNNQAAIEQLRAPIFEDKVVDFIISKAQVTEKKVSVEELMRDPDEETDAATEGGAPVTRDAEAPAGA
ncbi:MAG: trigger factor [Geminicoccaceae bacterium]|nr:trigger factor [Geminicoccaceae bacterium]